MKKVKPKRTRSKGFIIFSVIVCLVIVLAAAWDIYKFYTLDLLPFMLFLMAAGILGLLGLLAILLQSFYTKKMVGKVLCSALSVILAVAYSIGGWYLSKTSGALNSITSTSDEVTVTVNVYALSSSTLNDENSLNNQEVGTLSNISTAATSALLTSLSDRGINTTQKSYDSVQSMATALLDGEVPAIIMTQGNADGIDNLEDENLKDFSNKTKIIYTYAYTRKKENTTVKVENITNTPFTVLLTGMDSRNGFSEASRSDVNMLATVNPNTKVVLLTSIPRDYYVATACEPDAGCQNGALDKLTHTGLHGTETTKKTIEEFMGITINYTMQVNFSSVVNLVDALGGIDVEVAPGYAVASFWTNPSYGVTEGTNHLNGGAALAYARERYAYTEGDLQRVKNQQQVLMAAAKKALSPSVIVNYPSLMDALAGAMNTDISSEEIQQLIQFQLNDMPEWTFITYSLNGTGSTAFCAELGNTASVMLPDSESIQTAQERIKAVLEGKSSEEVEAINPTGSEPEQTEQSEDAAAEQPVTEDVQDVQVVEEPTYTDDQYYYEDQTDYNTYQPVYIDPNMEYAGGYYDEYGYWHDYE